MTRFLVVIGAQRSGTTFLRRVLEAHPDIATAQPARPEPKVFLDDEVLARGRDWYVETWFAGAGDAQVLAEKSTSYLEHPAAARRIRDVLGDEVDIVVQLRDPVARAVSNWRFSTSNGLEHRPLADALRSCLADEAEHDAATAPQWDAGRTSVSPFAYLERGHYVDQLEPWWEVFGDRVHVLFFEETTADADAARRLYADLGLSADVPVDTSAENASEGSEPELPRDLLADLRAHFSQSDRRLAEHLGRPVPWPTHDDRKESVR